MTEPRFIKLTEVAEIVKKIVDKQKEEIAEKAKKIVEIEKEKTADIMNEIYENVLDDLV